jgi:hypothetical protein
MLLRLPPLPKYHANRQCLVLSVRDFSSIKTLADLTSELLHKQHLLGFFSKIQRGWQSCCCLFILFQKFHSKLYVFVSGRPRSKSSKFFQKTIPCSCLLLLSRKGKDSTICDEFLSFATPTSPYRTKPCAFFRRCVHPGTAKYSKTTCADSMSLHPPAVSKVLQKEVMCLALSSLQDRHMNPVLRDSFPSTYTNTTITSQSLFPNVMSLRLPFFENHYSYGVMSPRLPPVPKTPPSFYHVSLGFFRRTPLCVLCRRVYPLFQNIATHRHVSPLFCVCSCDI